MIETKAGSIELICGCMFSGKSEELIRRVNRALIAKQFVQVFKSHRDVRYSKTAVQTHVGISLDATMVPHSSSKILSTLIRSDSAVVAIDEVQFFDVGIVQICEEMANFGKRVILAGLDLDFRGVPFNETILQLIAKAEYIDKLTAVCVVCGEPATRTQRLVNNEPAKWNEPIIVNGSSDRYEPVCRKHFRIERPTNEEQQLRYKVIENL